MTQEVEYSIRDWYFAVINEDYRSILIEILSHPEELPTLDELTVSVQNSSIKRHIETLIDAGIITRVYHPEHSEPFYSFTDHGKQFVYDTRIHRGGTILKQMYYSTEFPEYITEKQSLPRPEHPPVTKEYEEREEVWDTKEGKQAKSLYHMDLLVVATIKETDLQFEVFELDIFTNYPKRQLSETRLEIPSECIETIVSDTPKTAYWKCRREPFESDYEISVEWDSTKPGMPQCSVYKVGGVTREKLGGFSFL